MPKWDPFWSACCSYPAVLACSLAWLFLSGWVPIPKWTTRAVKSICVGSGGIDLKTLIWRVSLPSEGQGATHLSKNLIFRVNLNSSHRWLGYQPVKCMEEGLQPVSTEEGGCSLPPTCDPPVYHPHFIRGSFSYIAATSRSKAITPLGLSSSG